MKLSKHFRLEEFVPRTIFEKYGEAAQWFIDPKLVQLMEALRVHYNAPVTINTWYRDGHLGERGYRMPDTSTGAWYSQHKFGRACDYNVQGMSSDEVYDEILANEELFMDMGITTIEDKLIAKTWTHVDIRWTGMDRIKIVRP